MKLIAPCTQCTKDAAPEAPSILWIEIEDGAYYETTCPNQHRSGVILTTRRFEVLFEFGAMALLDGYPREAVSSFSVALERFQEFATKALLLAGGLDAGLVNKAWKALSNQSERQLGAFASVFLREYREVAPMLPNRLVEFRNKVVHKGYIPTRAEAEDFGGTVLQNMVGVYRRVYESHYAGISVLDGILLGEAYAARGTRTSVGSISIATIFSHAAADGAPTFQAALQELASRMQAIYKR